MRRRITPVPERWFGFLWRWRYPIWIVGLVMLIGGIAINRFVVAGWSSMRGNSAGELFVDYRNDEWQPFVDFDSGMGWPGPFDRSAKFSWSLSMSDEMFGVSEFILRVDAPAELDRSGFPGAAENPLSLEEVEDAWPAVLTTVDHYLEWLRSNVTPGPTSEAVDALLLQLSGGPGKATLIRRAWLSPMLPAIGRWSPRVSYALMGLGALIVLGLYPIGVFRFNTYLKRVRAKQCLKCAYPIEQSTTCPECGFDQSEMIAAVERLAQGRGFNRQNRN